MSKKIPESCPVCGNKKGWKLVDVKKIGGVPANLAMIAAPLPLAYTKYEYHCRSCGYTHEYKKFEWG